MCVIVLVVWVYVCDCAGCVCVCDSVSDSVCELVDCRICGMNGRCWQESF